MLQQLGPTYVKIGQMMASRSDILPPDWIDELSKLQSEAAPFGYDDVVDHRHQGARRAARGAVRDLRSRARSPRRPRPRSTRRRLHDGTLVAVKVQRPRILAKTQADLGVIQELAGVAEQRLAIARKVGLQAIVAEFAAGRPQGARLPQRGVPRPAARRRDDSASRRSTSRSSTTTCPASGSSRWSSSTGIKISKADELRAAGFDTTELGTVFIRAIIKQVLVDGFFHGDPHPGNILADPESKQIIFLDLGLVGQLNSQQRVDLLGLIYAIKEIDIPGIGDGLLALGKPTRQFDEAGSATTSTGSPAST